MSATLALLASGRPDEALVEFLRIVAGIVAAGGNITLVEMGPGHGLLEQDDRLPDDASRYLEALAEFEVRPQRLAAADLLHVVRSHGPLIRLGDPARGGQPAVLRIDDAWLAAATGREDAAVKTIVDAGQVVRV